MTEPIPHLSPRHHQILDTSQNFRDQHGYPPTLREIAGLVGLRSFSTVQVHLKTLERLGMLSGPRMRARAIEQPCASWRPDTGNANQVALQRPEGTTPRGGHYERGCCFEVTHLETGLRFVEIVTLSKQPPG